VRIDAARRGCDLRLGPPVARETLSRLVGDACQLDALMADINEGASGPTTDTSAIRKCVRLVILVSNMPGQL
jgi:hypothetical protein